MTPYLHLETMTDIEDLKQKIEDAVHYDQLCNHDNKGKRLRQSNGETRLLLEIHKLTEEIKDLHYDHQERGSDD